MAYLNKVLLIGNIGKDPEIRVTQNGKKQARFTFATTERFKNKTTGERRDRTEWHNITAWGSGAEHIERMGLRKGVSLHIEGRICYRSWDDPSGQKKYMTEIELERFQILSPRSAQGNGEGAGYDAGYAAGQQSAPAGQADYPEGDPDDLPF